MTQRDLADQREIQKENGVWGNMLLFIWEWLPRTVLAKAEGKPKDKTKLYYPWPVYVLPMIIIALSVGSITVITKRVNTHDVGLMAVIVSMATAALVPMMTIVASFVRSKWRFFFWFIAIFFGIVSGAIQFLVYSEPNMTLPRLLESIAFAYGLPFAEVMVAVAEATIINQVRDDHALELKRQDEEKAEAIRKNDEAERREQKKIEDAEERERKRKQADIELELRMEAQRKRLEEELAYEHNLREIEIKAKEAELIAKEAEIEEQRKDNEINRQARLLKAQKDAEKAAGKPRLPNSNLTPKQMADYQLGLQLIDLYKENGQLSDTQAGEELGIGRKKVGTLRKALNDIEVIDVDSAPGRPNTVSVNGQESAYRAGPVKLI